MCETAAKNTEAWQVASPSHTVDIGWLLFDLCPQPLLTELGAICNSIWYTRLWPEAFIHSHSSLHLTDQTGVSGTAASQQQQLRHTFDTSLQRNLETFLASPAWCCPFSSLHNSFLGVPQSSTLRNSSVPQSETTEWWCFWILVFMILLWHHSLQSGGSL